MNSANNVGELFTKAGEAYNKLGDQIMNLHPAAKELHALDAQLSPKKVTDTFFRFELEAKNFFQSTFKPEFKF